MSGRVSTLALALALLVGLVPADGSAQASWLPPDDAPTSGSVEVFRASFDNEAVGGLTSNVHLGFSHALQDGVRLLIDVPLSYADLDGPFGGETSFSLGNPYAAVLLGPADAGASVEAGIRIPLASDDESASWTGMLADWDRAEAFVSEYMPLVVQGRWVGRHDDGLVTRIHVGPSLWLHTGDGDADSELFVLYGGEVGVESGRGYVGGRFTGRWWTGMDDASFAEATTHHVGLTGSYRFGRVTPAIHLRIPVDDEMGEIQDFAFGIGVHVSR